MRNNIRNTDHTMSDNNVMLLNNRAVTKYRLSYGDSDPFSTSSCCTVRDDRSLMWLVKILTEKSHHILSFTPNLTDFSIKGLGTWIMFRLKIPWYVPSFFTLQYKSVPPLTANLLVVVPNYKPHLNSYCISNGDVHAFWYTFSFNHAILVMAALDISFWASIWCPLNEPFNWAVFLS